MSIYVEKKINIRGKRSQEDMAHDDEEWNMKMKSNQ
jgi:hypothetical protein